MSRSGLPLDELRERMLRSLKPGRYAHSLAVADCSRELAAHFGLDAELAGESGLLHDLMHCLSAEEYLSWSLVYGVPVGPAELEDPQLLHGPLAAAVLVQDYSCTCDELLTAVRCHTVPEQGMSDLAKVVYLADMLEPTRRPFPGVEALRECAWRDLDLGMAAALRHTLVYLQQQGKTPHPATESLVRYYEEQALIRGLEPLVIQEEASGGNI